MKVYRSITELPKEVTGAMVTIGSFDGFHLGHKALLKRLCQLAQVSSCKTMVITFSPHPVEVLDPLRPFLKLFSENEIIEQARSLNIDYLVFQPFDKALSKIKPQDFVENWIDKFISPKGVVLGYDFGFGNNKEGGVYTFKDFYKGTDIVIEQVNQVFLNGLEVSSTGIRKALQSKNLDLANQLFGEPYFIYEKVVADQKKGRLLGFPTANQKPNRYLALKNGVYKSRVWIDDRSYASVTNIGVRPTVSSDAEVYVETHIFDFSADLYNSYVRVEFLAFIREEKKFESLDALKEQIAKDCMIAKED